MNIVDLAIKSVVISILGLALLAMTRRGSAATRHFALALTLFSLCALPLIAPLLPMWQVPFITVKAPAGKIEASVPATVAPATSPNVHSISAPYQMDRESAITILWASVATLLALRVITRLTRLRRLERRLPMCAQPELQSIVADYCRQHGRHFLLLEGESNEPPMTWGHSRPVLLLPSVARDWPLERLRSVMLHELAHVERGDWIVSVASEIVCALFWFNPLVWAMRRGLEVESELAADDRVLSMGVPRTQYATHLFELLRDLNQFPKSADAAVAMARPGRLDARIKAILEDRRSGRSLRGGASLGLVTVVSALVIAVGAAGPTVVRDSALRTASRWTPPPAPEAGPILSQSYEDKFNEETAAGDDLADLSDDATGAVPPVPIAEPPRPAPTPKAVRAHAVAAAAAEQRAVSSDSRTISMSSGPDGGDVAMVTSGDHAPIRLKSIAVAGAPAAGSKCVSDQDDPDGSDSLIPVREIQSAMKESSKEIQAAVEEANRETAKAGVDLDVVGIIDGALKAVGQGLNSVHLSKKQLDAVRAETLAAVARAKKALPPSKPDPGH
jgi:beta-lactamase regulating signal transducer with metallopeptidase domain